MSTFTSRTITSTRREWIVPAAKPWGAAADEIGKAWAAAEKAYRETNGVPEGSGIAGNALAFHVGDDAVVIAFTTEATGEAS